VHVDLAIRLMAELLWLGLLVCAPILGVTLVVGLLVSVLQIVTQIQEMSLSFVPKLFAAAAAVVVAGPWALRQLTGYVTRLWLSIPSMF